MDWRGSRLKLVLLEQTILTLGAEDPVHFCLVLRRPTEASLSLVLTLKGKVPTLEPEDRLHFRWTLARARKVKLKFVQFRLGQTLGLWVRPRHQELPARLRN